MPADWSRFASTITKAAAEYASLKPFGLPDLHGSNWWGSSDEFRKYIRQECPDLDVDERAVEPMDGKPFWLPEDESPPGPGGPCGYCLGTIEPGSSRVCLKCFASGHERELREQRRIAMVPARTVLGNKFYEAEYPPERPKPRRRGKKKKAKATA